MNKEEKLLEIVKKLEDVVAELVQISKEFKALESSKDVQVDLETIRACLAELLHDGKREHIVELLGKYGASCLSDVPEEHYSALLKDAEGLKNA